MEAKDTVVETDVHVYPDNFQSYMYTLEEQAEISFKAGFQKGQKQRDAAAFRRGKQVGRREAVEWIQQYPIYKAAMLYYGIPVTEWRAKLKEWGIQEVTM